MKKLEIIYSLKNENIFVDGDQVDYNINDNASQLRRALSVEFSKIVSLHGKCFWMTKTFERNTLQSMLFEDLCFIFSVLRLSKPSQRTKVYTSRVSVFLFFKGIADISFKSKMRFVCRRNFQKIRSIILNYRFLMVGVYRQISSHRACAKIENGSYVIQTWVTDRSIDQEQFNDPYFSGLKRFYESEGKNVKTLCMVYSTKNYRSLIASLRKLESAIFVSDFLRVSDFFRAYWANIRRKNIAISIGDIFIDGHCIRNVVVEYLLNEICEEADLMSIFASKLKCFKDVTVVVNHENMVTEKALIMGREDSQADFRIYGVFHSSKPRNLLCLDYTTDEELSVSLIPDKILFNSEVYLAYFLKNFPSLKTRMYPGFAFKQSLYNGVSRIRKVDESRVLILLPGLSEQVDFMLKMLCGLNLNDKKLIFRMHPMCDVSDRLKEVSGWEVEKLGVSLRDSVNLSYKVISMYSSAALEAALLGAYVGMIYDRRSLILNPFDETGIKSAVLISSRGELQDFMSQAIEQGMLRKDFFFTGRTLLRGFL